MKTETIMAALDALEHARSALFCGGKSIAEQMQIADECGRASSRLSAELRAHVPSVPVAVPVEWHDDKDDRADMHITTQPGDLDGRGRPLKPGS